MMHKTSLAAAAAAILVAVASMPAAAQGTEGYPSKPVRIVTTGRPLAR